MLSSPRVTKILRSMLLVGALCYVAVYVVVALVRMRYPFELEWTEGWMVEHALRILRGQSIYVAPSLHFMPIGYPPVFYYLSALAASVTGVGFLPLRLVSFLSSLGCLVFLYMIVERETRNRCAAILSGCLYAATYRASGCYFDVGRVDSLLMLFLLAALYVARFHSTYRAAVAAGVLFSLAMLTKQTAVVIAAPVILFYLFRNWRHGLVLILTVATIMGPGQLVLNYLYDGWYRYYLYERVSHHPLRPGQWWVFWVSDVARRVPAAALLGLAVFSGLRRTPPERWNALFYLLMAGGMILAAWIGKWSIGGDNNALFPAYAAFALLFGVGFAHVSERTRALPNGAPFLQNLLHLLCILQFALLLYNPLSRVPTRADEEAGRQLVDLIRRTDGEAWLTFHGYLPELAGKRSYALLNDYTLFGETTEPQQRMQNEIRDAIRNHRFAAIIMDAHALPEEWRPYYTLQGPVFQSSDVFYPVTGWRTRPKAVFVPREPPESLLPR
jgi:4-amino-4-deoxy-L-arabinose transferase-like glycosyltransferase